jgi:hypothetical protein
VAHLIGWRRRSEKVIHIFIHTAFSPVRTSIDKAPETVLTVFSFLLEANEIIGGFPALSTSRNQAENPLVGFRRD